MEQQTQKYPRTYHLPFSPGSTNDDKKLDEGWFKNFIGEEVVITEKLDGENIHMSQRGVFARSDGAETKTPWTLNIWEPSSGLYWKIKDLISDDEVVYGENLYGEHSIHYNMLTDYFHIFAVRNDRIWYSWNDVKMMSSIMNVPHVPELYRGIFYKEADLRKTIEELVKKPSMYGDVREGIVLRVTASFPIESFPNKVCKWVRPNHVQTDVHWTRNWKKAELTSSLK